MGEGFNELTEFPIWETLILPYYLYIIHIPSIIKLCSFVRSFVRLFRHTIFCCRDLPVDRCDMHLWYLDMLTEGVFRGHMTTRKQSIKSKIEHVIATDEGLVEVDCRMLRTYERLLRAASDDETHAGKYAKKNEIETNASTSPSTKRGNVAPKNDLTRSDQDDIQLNSKEGLVDALCSSDITEAKQVFNNDQNEKQSRINDVTTNSGAGEEFGHQEKGGKEGGKGGADVMNSETFDTSTTNTDNVEVSQGSSASNHLQTVPVGSTTETPLDNDKGLLGMDPQLTETHEDTGAPATVSDASNTKLVGSFGSDFDGEPKNTSEKSDGTVSQVMNGHPEIDEKTGKYTDSGSEYVAKIDAQPDDVTSTQFAVDERSTGELVDFYVSETTRSISNSGGIPLEERNDKAQDTDRESDDSSAFTGVDPTDSGFDDDDEYDFEQESPQNVIENTVETPYAGEILMGSSKHRSYGVTRNNDAPGQQKYITHCHMSHSFVLACSLSCHYASLFHRTDTSEAMQLHSKAENYHTEAAYSTQTSSYSSRDTPPELTTATRHGEDAIAKFTHDSDHENIIHPGLASPNLGNAPDTSVQYCNHCHGSLGRLASMSNAHSRDYDRKFDMLELQLLRLENRLLLGPVLETVDSATMSKLENNLLGFENRLLRLSRDLAAMQVDHGLLRREAPSDNAAVVRRELGALGGRVVDLTNMLEEQAARTRHLEARMTRLEEVNAALRVSSVRLGDVTSATETDIHSRSGDDVSDHMHLQPLDVIGQDSGYSIQDLGQATTGDNLVLGVLHDGTDDTRASDRLVNKDDTTTRDNDDRIHHSTTLPRDGDYPIGVRDDTIRESGSVLHNKDDTPNSNSDILKNKASVSRHAAKTGQDDTRDAPDSSVSTQKNEQDKEQRSHKQFVDKPTKATNGNRQDEEALHWQEFKQHVTGSVVIEDDRSDSADSAGRSVLDHKGETLGSRSVGHSRGPQTGIQGEPTEELTEVISGKEGNINAESRLDSVTSDKHVDSRGKIKISHQLQQAEQQQRQQQQSRELQLKKGMAQGQQQQQSQPEIQQRQQQQHQQQQQPSQQSQTEIQQQQQQQQQSLQQQHQEQQQQPSQQRQQSHKQQQQNQHNTKNPGVIVSHLKSDQKAALSPAVEPKKTRITNETMNSSNSDVTAQNQPKAKLKASTDPGTKPSPATNATKPLSTRKAKRKPFQIPEIPKYTKRGHTKPKGK